MADGLGEFLRRERELRHISLDDVAERTKISRRYLEAIEEGRYDRLPGETFVRGFIRSYAQSVGLDPEDTLLRVQPITHSSGDPLPRTERPFLAGARGMSASLLWLLVAGVVIVGGVLVSLVGIVKGPAFCGGHRLPAQIRPTTPTDGAPLVLTAIADSDTWLRVTIDEQPDTGHGTACRAVDQMDWSRALHLVHRQCPGDAPQAERPRPHHSAACSKCPPPLHCFS